MSPEQIEYELVTHQGAMVSVVRPGYGKQSDSFAGRLTVVNETYPPKFQVSNELSATLFVADDVASLEIKKADGMLFQENQIIIRLKGPMDYQEQVIMCSGPMA